MKLNNTILVISLIGFNVGIFSSKAEAVVVFDDGAIHPIDYVIDDSVEVYNNFWYETTSINLVSGGWVVKEILAYQNSIINVFDGQIGEALFSNSNLYSYDMSQVNVSGGKIIRYLIAEDNGSINFSGGEVGRSMYGYDDSHILISGGLIQEYLYVYGDAAITNGQITSNIEAFGSVVFSGGSTGGNLNAHENSSVYILGGQIDGYLDIYFGSTVIVEGINFIIDGHPVTGEIVNSLNVTNYGHLTGTYLNGNPVDIDLKMSPGSSITFIPEPATFLLFGLGSLALFRKYN